MADGGSTRRRKAENEIDSLSISIENLEVSTKTFGHTLSILDAPGGLINAIGNKLAGMSSSVSDTHNTLMGAVSAAGTYPDSIVAHANAAKAGVDTIHGSIAVVKDHTDRAGAAIADIYAKVVTGETIDDGCGNQTQVPSIHQTTEYIRKSLTEAMKGSAMINGMISSDTQYTDDTQHAHNSVLTNVASLNRNIETIAAAVSDPDSGLATSIRSAKQNAADISQSIATTHQQMVTGYTVLDGQNAPITVPSLINAMPAFNAAINTALDTTQNINKILVVGMQHPQNGASPYKPIVENLTDATVAAAGVQQAVAAIDVAPINTKLNDAKDGITNINSMLSNANGTYSINSITYPTTFANITNANAAIYNATQKAKELDATIDSTITRVGSDMTVDGAVAPQPLIERIDAAATSATAVDKSLRQIIDTTAPSLSRTIKDAQQAATSLVGTFNIPEGTSTKIAQINQDTDSIRANLTITTASLGSVDAYIKSINKAGSRLSAVHATTAPALEAIANTEATLAQIPATVAAAVDSFKNANAAAATTVATIDGLIKSSTDGLKVISDTITNFDADHNIGASITAALQPAISAINTFSANLDDTVGKKTAPLAPVITDVTDAVKAVKDRAQRVEGAITAATTADANIQAHITALTHTLESKFDSLASKLTAEITKPTASPTTPAGADTATITNLIRALEANLAKPQSTPVAAPAQPLPSDTDIDKRIEKVLNSKFDSLATTLTAEIAKIAAPPTTPVVAPVKTASTKHIEQAINGILDPKIKAFIAAIQAQIDNLNKPAAVPATIDTTGTITKQLEEITTQLKKIQGPVASAPVPATPTVSAPSVLYPDAIGDILQRIIEKSVQEPIKTINSHITYLLYNMDYQLVSALLLDYTTMLETHPIILTWMDAVDIKKYMDESSTTPQYTQASTALQHFISRNHGGIFAARNTLYAVLPYAVQFDKLHHIMHHFPWAITCPSIDEFNRLLDILKHDHIIKTYIKGVKTRMGAITGAPKVVIDPHARVALNTALRTTTTDLNEATIALAKLRATPILYRKDMTDVEVCRAHTARQAEIKAAEDNIQDQITHVENARKNLNTHDEQHTCDLQAEQLLTQRVKIAETMLDVIPDTITVS